MTRSRHTPEPGPDRWLISYSDFITLLLALFVVMYAVAQSHHDDAKLLSKSVTRALRGQSQDQAPPVSKIDASAIDNAESLVEAHHSLQRLLQSEIAAGEMDLALDSRGVVISLREKGFFPSGGDQLYPSALNSLEKVAGIIHQLPNDIRLEGHTDSLPIHNARFRSNWDLSVARAIAVLTLMEDQFGLPARRFAIAGYADNQPIADNESVDGRALNRRVDMVIVGAHH